MNFLECVKMAFSSIRANKMRSLLTMLGIIIGISAVITITTIGNSLHKIVDDAFGQFSTNIYDVGFSRKNYDTDEIAPYSREDFLTYKTPYDIAEKYPDYFELCDSEGFANGTVRNEDDEISVSITGVQSGYLEFMDIDIISGRGITYRDDVERKYTAVVTESFAEDYGKGDSILGKPVTISIDESEVIEVYVVGICKDNSKDVLSEGTHKSYKVFIPYLTVFDYQGLNVETLYTTWMTFLWNKEYGKEVTFARLQSYFDKIYENNEYWTMKVYDWYSDEVDDINNVLKMVTLAFAVIAAISLLVGGIGVMNIMLVSITERTSEIGIRKALGAQNSAIRVQFVTEAIVLSLLGGIIGILIGLGSSYLIGAVGKIVLDRMSKGTSSIVITIAPSIAAIIISVLCSMAIGLIFGYYPANRAAKMNPIDALRYD